MLPTPRRRWIWRWGKRRTMSPSCRHPCTSLSASKPQCNSASLVPQYIRFCVHVYYLKLYLYNTLRISVLNCNIKVEENIKWSGALHLPQHWGTDLLLDHLPIGFVRAPLEFRLDCPDSLKVEQLLICRFLQQLSAAEDERPVLLRVVDNQQHAHRLSPLLLPHIQQLPRWHKVHSLQHQRLTSFPGIFDYSIDAQVNSMAGLHVVLHGHPTPIEAAAVECWVLIFAVKLSHDFAHRVGTYALKYTFRECNIHSVR
mmetsp:Transcript_28398/g.61253  ORF Transcript_28398/g.61253 Transcript_28398/m.61253 type:complete len:256 (-) Transcript_28398:291-1058(-)